MTTAYVRLTALVLLAAAGCVRVKVDPIKITVDVNIKIDRQLDDFYAFQGAATRPAAPASSPAGAR